MKNIILHKINGEIYSYRPYGICEDSSSTQNKNVRLLSPESTDTSHKFSLVPGATILVTFTDINNTENTTLNVNSTGDKAIVIGTNPLSQSQTWIANDTIEFRYDGTNWVMLNAEMSIDKIVTKTLYTLTDNLTMPTLPTIDENGNIILDAWSETPQLNDFKYSQNAIWSTTIKSNYKSNTVHKDDTTGQFVQFTTPMIITGLKGDNGTFITEYVESTKTLKFTSALTDINLNLKEY